jgi:hypothetical protein
MAPAIDIASAGMQAWEHRSVRFGAEPSRPWVSASDTQMRVVEIGGIDV